MSRSEDINTLFRRFGGDVSDYQEIMEMDKEQAIKAKWPLLAMVDLNSVQVVPSVQLQSAEVESASPGIDSDLMALAIPSAQENALHSPPTRVTVRADHEAKSPEGGNLFAKFSKNFPADGGLPSVTADTKLDVVFARLAGHSQLASSISKPLKKPIKW